MFPKHPSNLQVLFVVVLGTLMGVLVVLLLPMHHITTGYPHTLLQLQICSFGMLTASQTFTLYPEQRTWKRLWLAASLALFCIIMLATGVSGLFIIMAGVPMPALLVACLVVCITAAYVCKSIRHNLRTTENRLHETHMQQLQAEIETYRVTAMNKLFASFQREISLLKGILQDLQEHGVKRGQVSAESFFNVAAFISEMTTVGDDMQDDMTPSEHATYQQLKSELNTACSSLRTYVVLN